MVRLVSLIVLAVLIVFLGITFFQVIAPFLLPLFLAGVVAIIARPLFDFFVKKTNGRIRLAAGLTAGSVLAGILIPLSVGTLLASVQLYVLAQDTLTNDRFGKAVHAIRAELEIDHIAERLEPFLSGPIDPEKLQRDLQASVRAGFQQLAQRSLGLAGAALGLVGTVVAGIIGLVMFMIALYYFLADGPRLLDAAQTLIPVQVDYQQRLLQRFESVVRAVVMATFAAAIAQGLLTAVALAIAGFPSFFILFILATLSALVPLAGTWLVWGPCAVWLAWQGQVVPAAVLAVFGAVVIGTMDNVIRTWLLHSDARLHPLLAFVSVLGGLQAMGLWGVFVGPIVASCLHALVEIFNTELEAFSKEQTTLFSRKRPSPNDRKTAVRRPRPEPAESVSDADGPAAVLDGAAAVEHSGEPVAPAETTRDEPGPRPGN
ncbi:MAG: AI-2E family transporter [Planctomycetaceae bacterium]|nr:AI-2E family transporter [Planctomycetaceae bacterium]